MQMFVIYVGSEPKGCNGFSIFPLCNTVSLTVRVTVKLFAFLYFRCHRDRAQLATVCFANTLKRLININEALI